MHRLTTLVSNPSPIPADAPVTWTGGPPDDEEACVVRDAVGYGSPYATVVERVGERLFHRDLETLGVSADVGFFRPFYMAHARRLIASLAGTGLSIGGPA